MIPEISMNPLASRLVTLFPRDGDERINFMGFVMGLSIFSARATPAVIQRAVFRMFDVDGDGSVSAGDLRALLGLMVGKTLAAEGVEAVVAQTLEVADVDRDGRISFDDFERSSEAVAWDALVVPVKSSHRWQVQQGLVSAASYTRLPAAT